MTEELSTIVETSMDAVELLKVHDDSDFPIDGRELHEALGIETKYNDWFPRMCEYGFTQGHDFNLLKKEKVQIEGNREVTRTIINHELTLTMAKEICMVQRTEIGRKIRQHLIHIEEAWNTPEQIMSRALKVADDVQRKLKFRIAHLQADNSRLTVENQIMQPKADYFDQLVERNLLTSFRDTAKELNIPEKTFISMLIEKKYIFRDKKNKLMPCARKNDGLFEVKECFNEKTNWSGTQTMITPKGKETFRLLTEGM